MPYSKAQLTGVWSRDDPRPRDRQPEGALWAWGDAVKHGYWKGHTPSDPDVPRLAVHFGPRLPCDDTYLDLCRAFAALHPATRGLADTGSMGWLVRVPELSHEQEAIHLYYVEGFGLHQFRRDFRKLSDEQRSRLLELWRDNPGAYAVEDTDGDGLVAAKVGCHPKTAERRRMRGIDQMVRFLQPVGREERAA